MCGSVILAVRPEQFGSELTAEGLTAEELVQNQILDAPSTLLGVTRMTRIASQNDKVAGLLQKMSNNQTIQTSEAIKRFKQFKRFKRVKRSNNSFGFSLIELLLVLAVLSLLIGVAMVGLNPMEQTRKSRDVGKLNKAREAFKAAEAYYAFHQNDPVDDGGGSLCPSLITSGNLKSGSCEGIVLTGSNGDYQATFEAVSKAYRDTCGGTTCTVPDDF